MAETLRAKNVLRDTLKGWRSGSGHGIVMLPERTYHSQIRIIETDTMSGETTISRYKCFVCKLVIKSEDVIQINTNVKKGAWTEEKVVPGCPVCQNPLVAMCKRDHTYCTHDIVPGIAYCPDCGEAMCPVCGSHDVAQISRVTGYLQEVHGWNAGKQQELKDRTRYDPMTGGPVKTEVPEREPFVPSTISPAPEPAKILTEVRA